MSTNVHYLNLLSKSFPTIASAATEVINLEAILNLPKGTEHFLADLHGEHEAFIHVIRNASGNIKRKVNDIFGNTIRDTEKRELCTLIYYPEQKLKLIKESEEDLEDWYRITIHQLVRVCREMSSKYTRSKVRKTLPPEFSYIIEELLHEHTDDQNKAAYVAVVVDTIISTGRADAFIIAISNVIHRLAIDHLHILGDIYDRGPGAHIILDTLCQYKSWDIQWGNHDMLWMGAAAGSDVCIASVLRLSMRYPNLPTIEEGYGINLLPLATFALEVYGNDPCTEFLPKQLKGAEPMDEKSLELMSKMHKAMAVIQFKLESTTFRRHPEWHMDDRCMLERIDYDAHTCEIDGKIHEMSSCNFPTVDPANPSQLTPAEVELMQKLHKSFVGSEKLQRHIHTILNHGSMYLVSNQNLLYHASVPLCEDGTLKQVEIMGKKYEGRQLMDQIEHMVRAAYDADSPQRLRDYALDYFLYLWLGKDSPLFDKARMTTFERYFLDKSTFHEEKGHYFKYRDSVEVCERILDAFGVKGNSRHIINGHVPVHASDGESPIKAGGRMMVIDGGFSQAYHKETGIAGYTLVYHSRGFQLVQHEPFTSTQDAIIRGTDIKSTIQIVEMSSHRMLVNDTDKGEELRTQISELKDLLHAYRHGIIKEHQK